MWLRRINDYSNEFRYELESSYSAPLMQADGSKTQIFVLYCYYKNNDGEFRLMRTDDKIHVTIETLLSEFVAIDSKMDKTITELQDFKCNTQAKNLEDSLKPFCFDFVEEHSVEEPSDMNSCIKSETNGND